MLKSVLNARLFASIVILTAHLSMNAQEVKAVHIAEKSVESAGIKKMTPNLYADDVEACVDFWVKRLHFEKTMEVKANKGLAFAALRKGRLELMYGSYASLEVDKATADAYKRGTSTLFLEVEDVEAIFAAMRGANIVSGMHKTFYGSREFTVTDPAGHLLTFAQMQAHP